MKHFFSGALMLLSAFMAIAQTTNTVTEANASLSNVSPEIYANTITQEELKEHLYTFASDEFMGRLTGTAGEKMAVDYLVNTYKHLGINGGGDHNEYLQKVPLRAYSSPTGSLAVKGRNYELGEEALSLHMFDPISLNLVYAGYGIETPEYSSYTNLDVKDKGVIVKIGEPVKENGNYFLTNSKEASFWSNNTESFEYRLQAAHSKGAKALIIRGDKDFVIHQEYLEDIKDLTDTLIMYPKDIMNEIMVFSVKDNFLKETIDSMKSPAPLKNLSLELNGEPTGRDIFPNNVIAIIPGKTIPDEYIVLSAHLDHFGHNAKGKVLNGADDNGSGTVALLEIAEAFKTASEEGNGPARSVVFIHFAAEEFGLFGSRYYVYENPLYPLENTVANLNLDMIGRDDPERKGDQNFIYLIAGDAVSSELHKISEEVNRKYTQLKLDYSYNDPTSSRYDSSDHVHFMAYKIPVIKYWSGVHEDWNQPTDTPDKIPYDVLEKRTKLIFHTAWELANRPERIKLDKINAE